MCGEAVSIIRLKNVLLPNTMYVAKFSLPIRNYKFCLVIDRVAVVSLTSNCILHSLRLGNVSCLRIVHVSILMPRNVNR